MQAHTNLPKNREVLFEPDLQSLGNYGLSTEEAMFQVSPNGELYIPVQNFQQSTICLPEGMQLRQVESMSDTIQSPHPQTLNLRVLSLVLLSAPLSLMKDVVYENC